MNKTDIIRAWKDTLYRASLSSEEQAQVPAHPAGEIQLTEKETASVNGGALTLLRTCPTNFGCTKVGTCHP